MEEDYKGPVNNVLSVSPQEKIKRHNIGRARRPWNWSITSNPAPREMHVKRFSGNTRPLRGWIERRPCWSCLAFCSIDSTHNNTFWIHFLIFRKQFYFVVSGLKIIGHGNLDSNFESPCVSLHCRVI
jgi:hypothetical protein